MRAQSQQNLLILKNGMVTWVGVGFDRVVTLRSYQLKIGENR